MEKFINSNLDNLVKIYIQERQAIKNELGVLYLEIIDGEMKVRYLPLSNPYLSNEIRDDIQNKNNNRNSNMFIVFDKQLMVLDLENYKTN
jgi:hypothetical protein